MEIVLVGFVCTAIGYLSGRYQGWHKGWKNCEQYFVSKVMVEMDANKAKSHGEWDERRIDVIGQNGNVGYEENEIFY